MKRKRGVARTMMDMFVNLGNSLTGGGQSPEPPMVAEETDRAHSEQWPHEHAAASQVSHGHSSSPSREQQEQHQPQEQYQQQSHEQHQPQDPQGEQRDQQQEQLYEPQEQYQQQQDQYQADGQNYHAESQYNDENSHQDAVADQQTFYSGSRGLSADDVVESRGDHIPRTLLDHSVLFDTVSRSAEKKILKAAEDQQERLHEPFVPFIPVQEDKLAGKCPWKWEGDESKDHVRYCGSCQHQVYNFHGMERPEADALVLKYENHDAKVLYKREDGKFMTSDCPMAAKSKNSMVLAVVGRCFCTAAINLFDDVDAEGAADCCESWKHGLEY